MSSIRVLLIEDDVVDQLAFKRLLDAEALTYNYEIVDSLAQARRLVLSKSFDAIIADYHLGDGTALEMLEIAKGIPLVIITGAGNEEIAVRALKSGAFDYIVKDVERNYLKLLPLTVQKAVRNNVADRQRDMLLNAIMHISDSVYVTNVDGTIGFVNKAFTQTYGYETEEIIGHEASRLGDQKEGEECFHRKKDGAEFLVSLSSSTVRDQNGNVTSLVSVARDATDRKEAEQALQASEEKYRQFFYDDLAGVFVCKPDGKMLSCNPSFARIFGFHTVEEAIRYNLIALYPKSRLFAEVRDLVRLNKKLEYYEVQLRRYDGTPVYIIQNIIGKFDENGELQEIKGYVFDNTRHKLLEEQLRQAQKMESIGTLAGGIAHDFNNILAIIMGHTQVLMKGDPTIVAKANSVETINRAVHRGAKLVKQILTFARRDEIVFEPVNLNLVIEELHKMLAETFPKIIDFKLELHAALPPTIADQGQVHQALLNLCVNARDAMPNGGTLTIESELVRGMFLRERFPEAHEHMYVCLSVRDSGTGMPSLVLSRMFEPFFTTKEIGKGTGLGLAVVYGVTKSHHGFVDVKSVVGEGTTFSLYFPMRRVENEIDPNETDHLTFGGACNETILVVEDEVMLLELVKVLLEGQGYTVLTAVNGQEALDIFAEKNEEIRLVLTDLGLPKVDGWEAFKAMKQINPNVKVIFASGYFDPTLRANLIGAGAKGLVQKPYLPEEILNRVRELVNSDVVKN